MSPAPPRVRSVVEDGVPVLTIRRGQHGSGRRELGGGIAVPIIVALSAAYQVERRTQAGVLRKSPTIGAVTVADPSERAIFTVEGQADVLQISILVRLIEEVAGARVQSVRSLFNEHDLAIERGAMAALVALSSDDSHSELLLHSVSYQLADVLGRARAPDGAPRRGGITRSALQRVHDLVQARLDEPLLAPPKLGEMAQAAGISKHHFIKAFRETVRETPYAWVMRQRIERARALLARSSQTVGDIAFQTGFSSPAHFAAAFRHRLGVTPGAFQKAVLK